MEVELPLNTYHQNGHEAGDRRVPVAIARRLADQHRVEDEIAQSELDATCNRSRNDLPQNIPQI